MQYKDYYTLLGIERSATQDDVKKAYRRLARKYHPDVSDEADAEARFKEINEAYEVLKDPEKRTAYDRLGANWKAGQDFTPPPGWDRGFEFRGGGFSGGGGSADFSDFFENLFGAGGPFSQYRPQGTQRRHGYVDRGEDKHAKIAVTLEDAVRGATRIMHLEQPEVDATGHVRTRTHSLKVKIPAGISPGQKIRLSGQGGRSNSGGADGDLFLEVEFKPHKLYRLQQRDIYLDLPITPWEAALGGKVEVPTLGGKVGMKIPPGARSGQKLRLKGRGLPGKEPGDQYVVLQIMTPPVQTSSQRKLYEKMAKEMPFNPRNGLEE